MGQNRLLPIWTECARSRCSRLARKRTQMLRTRAGLSVLTATAIIAENLTIALTHRAAAPHQRRKRGRMSAPSAAMIAVAIVYQVARKGTVSSGQCRL